MYPPTANDPTCPFCPFADSDANFVAEHVHFCHPEKDIQIGHGDGVVNSPEPSRPPPWQPNAERPTLESTYPSQANSSPLAMDSQKTEEPSCDSSKKRNSSTVPGDPREDSVAQDGVSPVPSRDTRREWKSMASHSKPAHVESTRKLGRTELGPHVHERQMPFWLRKMLEKGPKVTKTNQIAPDGTLQRLESVENEAPNIIPVLGRLCEADNSVKRAFLCSPKTCQVSKLPREGGFCGYRNIQMLISYIRQSDLPVRDRFSGPLPTILQLQDMIEHAWDMGINSAGREETGGIRGTRKFIGTSEAQALFLSLGIQCEACSIGETPQLRAHDVLLSNIAGYFRTGSSCHTNEKVIMTCLPPIYFQHQGHSLTIVGFEIRDNGSANLLVFDPMLQVPSGMKRSTGVRSKFRDPLYALKGYRRGIRYLQKYQIFEILKLPPPTNPGAG